MAKAQYLGVYSLRSSKSAAGKRYCFVWRDTPAKACIFQTLDANLKPTGKPMLLPLEHFRRDFTAEPGIVLVPDIEPEVGDYLAKGASAPSYGSDKVTLISEPVEKPARKAAPAASVSLDGKSAAPQGREAEKQGVKRSPEELDKAIRGEFAMSMMRFRRGNKEGALQDFERLLAVEDGIVPVHKHMFTDFGIDLRKSKLYTLASRCFQRAVTLSPDDTHAIFNLARIYYEMGQYGKASRYLDAALEKEPDLKCALRLKARISEDLAGPSQGKRLS